MTTRSVKSRHSCTYSPDTSHVKPPNDPTDGPDNGTERKSATADASVRNEGHGSEDRNTAGEAMSYRRQRPAVSSTSSGTPSSSKAPGRGSAVAARYAIQRKETGASSVNGATQQLDRARASSGESLPADLQGHLEAALGTGLDGVCVHAGSESSRAAKAIGANAYTEGQDIHFAAGKYDPGSGDGQRLIAHEVAHTVQQFGASASRQAKPEISSPGDAHEREADGFGDAFVRGETFPVTAGSVSGGVHRDVSNDGDHASEPTGTRDGAADKDADDADDADDSGDDLAKARTLLDQMEAMLPDLTQKSIDKLSRKLVRQSGQTAAKLFKKVYRLAGNALKDGESKSAVGPVVRRRVALAKKMYRVLAPVEFRGHALTIEPDGVTDDVEDSIKSLTQRLERRIQLVELVKKQVEEARAQSDDSARRSALERASDVFVNEASKDPMGALFAQTALEVENVWGDIATVRGARDVKPQTARNTAVDAVSGGVPSTVQGVFDRLATLRELWIADEPDYGALTDGLELVYAGLKQLASRDNIRAAQEKMGKAAQFWNLAASARDHVTALISLCKLRQGGAGRGSVWDYQVGAIEVAREPLEIVAGERKLEGSNVETAAEVNIIEDTATGAKDTAVGVVEGAVEVGKMGRDVAVKAADELGEATGLWDIEGWNASSAIGKMYEQGMTTGEILDAMVDGVVDQVGNAFEAAARGDYAALIQLTLEVTIDVIIPGGAAHNARKAKKAKKAAEAADNAAKAGKKVGKPVKLSDRARERLKQFVDDGKAAIADARKTAKNLPRETVEALKILRLWLGKMWDEWTPELERVKVGPDGTAIDALERVRRGPIELLQRSTLEVRGKSAIDSLGAAGVGNTGVIGDLVERAKKIKGTSGHTGKVVEFLQELGEDAGPYLDAFESALEKAGKFNEAEFAKILSHATAASDPIKYLAQLDWLYEQPAKVRHALAAQMAAGLTDDLTWIREGGLSADDLEKLGDGDLVVANPGKQGKWNKKLNKPEPNKTYVMAETNYRYMTDGEGRVAQVKGELRLEDGHRNAHQQRTSGGKDRRTGDGAAPLDKDDGGHLIATIFKGPGEGLNLVPMNFNFNRGRWKELENLWARALAKEPPSEVTVRIEPRYDGSSARPSEFKVTYAIDGKRKVEVLANQHAGKQ